MVPTERPPVHVLKIERRGQKAYVYTQRKGEIQSKWCIWIPHSNAARETWLGFLRNLEEVGVKNLDDALDRLDCCGDFSRGLLGMEPESKNQAEFDRSAKLPLFRVHV